MLLGLLYYFYSYYYLGLVCGYALLGLPHFVVIITSVWFYWAPKYCFRRLVSSLDQVEVDNATKDCCSSSRSCLCSRTAVPGDVALWEFEFCHKSS